MDEPKPGSEWSGPREKIPSNRKGPNVRVRVIGVDDGYVVAETLTLAKQARLLIPLATWCARWHPCG